MRPLPPDFPDYDNPPTPFWEAHGVWLLPIAVGLLTALLTVVSFPPFEVPEAAYVLAVPGVLWAFRRPAWRLYAGTMLGSQVLAWGVMLYWLHHATWAGYLLLFPVIGLWVGSWFLLVRWAMPRILGLPHLNRLFAVAGLAAAWVLIEWSRTWVLSGFPWLPLAASQWQRSAMLQVAAFTGAGGVSFVLVLMNLGFAAYGHRLFFEKELKGLRKRSQELMLGLFCCLVCMCVFLIEAFNRNHFIVPLGRFGLVQPNVPQDLKWDPTQGPAIVETLQQATASAARRYPDAILWPEAVTPWVIVGGHDRSVRDFVEHTAATNETTLLLGSIGVEANPADGADPRWINGSFKVDPRNGLSADYYVKRHLVPFGEYVPLRPLLGWLEKVVPIGGDFASGEYAGTIPLTTRSGQVLASPLICYEDVFPDLARASVRAGGDLLIVQTNNGWFGEGGAAEQHAAHSVLRAVETRRPVIRVGNAGWSGWIDEFGATAAVLQRVARVTPEGTRRWVVSTKPTEEGSIYFKGSGVIDVTRDSRWIGRESFYVEHGDWFLLACVLLAGTGWFLVRIRQPKTDPVTE